MEIYYRFTLRNKSLSFYGLTKNPDNNEIMMVTGFASDGSLRGFLADNFPNLLWKKKLTYLKWIIQDLKNLHEQGICHKDFHSGNILLNNQIPYLTDFGLSGPANKDSKEIFGILTYVAPEVLKGKLYNASADIYSFGIIMTELSTGLPPHYNNKFNDDSMLALSICGGLRPDFGKGTPEVYKNLAHECMDANANKRPTAEKLENIILYLCDCLAERITDEEAKKIKAAFDKADNEIPNIQSKTNSDVKHTSKPLNFNDLPEPVNSSLIPAYADSGQLGINLSDDVDYDMDDDDDDDDDDNDDNDND